MQMLTPIIGGPRAGQFVSSIAATIPDAGGLYCLVETERFGIPVRYVWCPGLFIPPTNAPLPPLLTDAEVYSITRDIMRRAQSL